MKGQKSVEGCDTIHIRLVFDVSTHNKLIDLLLHFLCKPSAVLHYTVTSMTLRTQIKLEI